MSKELLQVQLLQSAEGIASVLLQIFFLLGAILSVVTALQEGTGGLLLL